jgi:hypothetical protein
MSAAYGRASRTIDHYGNMWVIDDGTIEHEGQLLLQTKQAAAELGREIASDREASDRAQDEAERHQHIVGGWARALGKEVAGGRNSVGGAVKIEARSSFVCVPLPEQADDHSDWYGTQPRRAFLADQCAADDHGFIWLALRHAISGASRIFFTDPRVDAIGEWTAVSMELAGAHGLLSDLPTQEAQLARGEAGWVLADFAPFLLEQADGDLASCLLHGISAELAVLSDPVTKQRRGVLRTPVTQPDLGWEVLTSRLRLPLGGTHGNVATEHEGRIYLAGGSTGCYGAFPTRRHVYSEILSLEPSEGAAEGEGGSWTVLGSLPQGCCGCALAALDVRHATHIGAHLAR